MARVYCAICIFAVALAGCGAADDGEPVTVSKSALVANSELCTGTEPDANHIMIWQNAHYTAPCRQLPIGFYPTPTNFGLPNDSISSVKVGSSVMVRFFKDSAYGGGYQTWFGGGFGDVLDLGGFNDQISSMRVMPNDNRQDCAGIRSGEIALFRDANFSTANDCVILPVGNYPTPGDMGIANDSISSIINASSHWIAGDFDAWYGPNPNLGVDVPPFSNVAALPTDKWLGLAEGINDNISSIEMYP